jgi:hypothetical protein
MGSAAPARSRSPNPPAWPAWILCLLPLAVTVWGIPYYRLGLAGRVRHPLHALLRPSGPVGMGLGIVAFAMFMFLWLYPLRKSIRWLAWTGSVGAWLRVHIVAGLAVPMFAAVHAGWRFDGLIGLGYGSMLLVAMSGVVGRYLYTRIPRGRNGAELGREEVANERRRLITEIALTTKRDPVLVERALAVDVRSFQGLGPLATVGRMIADDRERARAVKRLREAWRRPTPGQAPVDPRTLGRALALARRELSLAQQARLLDATRSVFGLWHVVHRPFAFTALIAVGVHVVVALLVGAVRPF